MRVTFVGHDASRTGAPVALWGLLRWLRSRVVEPAEIDLVLLRGGPLESRYRELVPTVALDASLIDRSIDAVGAGLPALSASSRARTAGNAVRGLHRRVRTPRHPEPDVVVANTFASLQTAASLVPSGSLLVVHVHELDHVAARTLPPGGTGRSLLERVDRFIAAGSAVERMLVARLGVPPDRVGTVSPFVETARPPAETVRALRREWGGQPVVISVGAAGHRKGTDRFADLISTLGARVGGVRGVWLGAEPGSTATKELHHGARNPGSATTIDVCPPRADVAAVLAAADVVVSTAREDPFPLALLETAAVGTPVVAFDSGGFGDVLRSVGFDDDLLPIGDVLGMARAVGALLSDPDEAARRGRVLRAHVQSQHSPELIAPQLWGQIVGAVA